jgi:hypothetical protein
MSTVAPVAKNRAIRLQQELVPMLRATGSLEGAKRYWRHVNFAKGFGRKLACYGFDKPGRQLLINSVAFPRINFEEVDAALAAGNNLRQICTLACGEGWISRDQKNQYKRAKKGLKILLIKSNKGALGLTNQ